VSRAVLSVGSNVGDRLGHLAGVVAAARPVAVSPVYETEPWGPVPQDEYLNVVLLADDPFRDASGWLAFAREREAAAGRVRDLRWGPRTLDVDVIQVTEAGVPVRRDDPQLTLPHPRAHQRAFVLVPWAAVEPGAVLAGHGPVSTLVRELTPDVRAGVRRRDDLTLEVPR